MSILCDKPQDNFRSKIPKSSSMYKDGYISLRFYSIPFFFIIDNLARGMLIRNFALSKSKINISGEYTCTSNESLPSRCVSHSS